MKEPFLSRSKVAFASKLIICFTPCPFLATAVVAQKCFVFYPRGEGENIRYGKPLKIQFVISRRPFFKQKLPVRRSG